MQTDATLIIAAVIVVAFLVLTWILGSLYRKVGPNEALIVFGRGGTKVVVGGGTVVLPLFQSADRFSLELLSFDIIPRSDLYSQQGIPVKIEAVTQLKVENEEEKIRRAANQFLSKRQEDRESLIRQVMEGHLRGIVGQLTVETLVKEPDNVSARMRDTVAADLDKLGLEVVSFTIKDVKDDSGYIANLSRPIIAANQRAAEIAEAEAQRDVAVSRAETQREAAKAQAQAEQEIAVARTQASATQAAAQRDLDLKVAEFKTSTATAQAQADMAGDIARAEAQRRLVEQQTQTDLLRAQRQKDVQAAEADRKQAELVAEVQRPAEARARAVQVQAEGEAVATRARAEAESEAARMRGHAVAEAEAAHVRETGNAEAETIRARGLAEAEALQAKVEAQNQQQEVSLATRMIDILPEMAGRLSEAYGKVGNVTYVANGSDAEGLTARIGHDLAGMIPVIGSMIQSVTGRSIASLLQSDSDGRVPAPAPETVVVSANPAPPVPAGPTPADATTNGDASRS